MEERGRGEGEKMSGVRSSEVEMVEGKGERCRVRRDACGGERNGTRTAAQRGRRRRR
jgi:hypothetical protein